MSSSEKKEPLDPESQRQLDAIVMYKRVFGTEHGREVLFDLMDRFHILNSHKGDAFAEGQRSVVLHILGQTKISLKDFEKLLRGDI